MLPMLDKLEFSHGLFLCELGTEDKKSQELPGRQYLPCDKVKEANFLLKIRIIMTWRQEHEQEREEIYLRNGWLSFQWLFIFWIQSLPEFGCLLLSWISGDMHTLFHGTNSSLIENLDWVEYSSLVNRTLCYFVMEKDRVLDSRPKFEECEDFPRGCTL